MRYQAFVAPWLVSDVPQPYGFRMQSGTELARLLVKLQIIRTRYRSLRTLVTRLPGSSVEYC